jgi:hypothetical protein
MQTTIEIYTCKLERTCSLGTATIGVVMSATRGTVEDMNKAIQRAVDVLREAFPAVEESK